MSENAYPLQWPAGWPRALNRRNAYSRFKGNTFARARDSLSAELERLGGKNVVLSSNVELRLDGQPRAGGADSLPDPGIAVYFEWRKRRLCMARDEFKHVSDNLRSLALAIEHLRGLERHGGSTMMDRAFTGFAALPAPGAKASCWEVLGLERPDGLIGVGAMSMIVHSAYRDRARRAHPDAGGSDAQMSELNVARDEALRELAG